MRGVSLAGRLFPAPGQRRPVRSSRVTRSNRLRVLNSSLEHVFSATGPLARAVPGYRPRPGQVELAESIARTLDSNGVLVAEAGTGTGKTFAYLVPAILQAILPAIILCTGNRSDVRLLKTH